MERMQNDPAGRDTIDQENTSPMPVILLVDDEASILSSLKRVLRPKGYQLLTAGSGAEGLRLLESNAVDLIMSDMRMPEMNGAQFLSIAKERHPDITRILLTGYSEISSTISAINEGGVYHYLQKPWDEQDLLLTIQRALEQQFLKRESTRLNLLVQKQNDELQNFNARLEKQVAARTEEIRQTVMFLENSQTEIKLNFLTMLKVFSNMIELRSGMLGGQSDRVSALMRKIGKKFKLPEPAIQDLAIAGLLHAIGKIGLPDELIRKPQEKMSGDESRAFMAHPVKGHMVLTPLGAFDHVGQLILHQYERYDGRGIPDSLSGESIPLGARILAVARDFEALRSGAIATLPLPIEKAIHIIKGQSGHRYDPLVVEHFIALADEKDPSLAEKTRTIKSRDLETGMQLAADLRTEEGVLLIVHDTFITMNNIMQIRKFEQLEGMSLRITIKLQETKS
jgi:adenylate cyclase